MFLPIYARHLSTRAWPLDAVACGEWLRLLLTDDTSSILSYATKKTNPRNFHAARFVIIQLWKTEESSCNILQPHTRAGPPCLVWKG